MTQVVDPEVFQARLVSDLFPADLDRSPGTVAPAIREDPLRGRLGLPAAQDLNGLPQERDLVFLSRLRVVK